MSHLNFGAKKSAYGKIAPLYSEVDFGAKIQNCELCKMRKMLILIEMLILGKNVNFRKNLNFRKMTISEKYELRKM